MWHVTHVDDALSVLRYGQILTEVVSDGRLSTEHIAASWWSPNAWVGNGYIYGNIAFPIKAELLLQMNAYWVEQAEARNPIARILLTPKDRTDRFDVYDPTGGDGPWWLNKEKHFRNGGVQLQILIERDVRLDELLPLVPVTHHDTSCHVHGSACVDLRRMGGSAHSLLLAAVCEEAIDGRPTRWTDEEQFVAAVNWLKAALDNKSKVYGGATRAGDDVAPALVRAVLRTYWRQRDATYAAHLRNSFATEPEWRTALGRVIRSTFALTDEVDIFKHW